MLTGLRGRLIVADPSNLIWVMPAQEISLNFSPPRTGGDFNCWRFLNAPRRDSQLKVGGSVPSFLVAFITYAILGQAARVEK